MKGRMAVGLGGESLMKKFIGQSPKGHKGQRLASPCFATSFRVVREFQIFV